MTEYRGLSRSAGMLAVIAATVLALSPLPAFGRMAITECGVLFISGGAELVGDLDCSVQGGTIHFRPSGKLFLNGFTMTGVNVFSSPFPPNPVNDNVRPGGVCVVQGPGTMIDGVVDATVSARVRDVTIVNGFVDARRVKIKRSTITAPADKCAIGGGGAPRIVGVVDSEVVGGACGISSQYRASLRRSVLRDSLGRGISKPNISLNITDSTVSGHASDGAIGNAVSVRDSVIINNGGVGIVGAHGGDLRKPAKLRVKGSTVSGNGAGILAIQDACIICGPLDASVWDSSITGNLLYGIKSERGAVKLKKATATGNGIDSECGVSVSCADVMARELPSIDNKSVCATSYDVISGFPGTSWGVCSLD